jgi:hypothetical protein
LPFTSSPFTGPGKNRAPDGSDAAGGPPTTAKHNPNAKIIILVELPMLKVDIILSSKLAVSEVYACAHYGIVAGKTRACENFEESDE